MSRGRPRLDIYSWPRRNVALGGAPPRSRWGLSEGKLSAKKRGKQIERSEDAARTDISPLHNDEQAENVTTDLERGLHVLNGEADVTLPYITLPSLTLPYIT